MIKDFQTYTFNNGEEETNLYFFHTDHLGSTLIVSYAKETIDIQDIESIGSENVITSVGTLIHECSEQYYKQTQKDLYIKAHAKATNIESIISNVKIEIDRDFYEDEWENGNISVFFRDNDAKRKSVFISYKKRNNLIVK